MVDNQAEAIEPRLPYGNKNLFTFEHGWVEEKHVSSLSPNLGPPDGYEQFDLGIIEVGDDGDFLHPRQLEQISQRIEFVRQSNDAIVVAFIHGWHNNAEWNNANLLSFRRLLQALMLREIEAPRSRRVIGVYIGWNGKPTDGIGAWISEIPLIQHATFRNRYRAAEKTGRGNALSEVLVELTLASKSNPHQHQPVPLILVGHSMGAFILQSTFRELLRHPDNPLVVPFNDDGSPVTVSTAAHDAVLVPDLMLSLNSAAESDVAKDIIRTMAQQGWEKRFDPKRVQIDVAAYNPPLLISATSSEDRATDLIWRAGHGFTKPSTDGHDKNVATHSFSASKAQADCPQANYPDFGQPWHCLHKDARQRDVTPRFRVDLPDHDRLNQKPLTHTAYDLDPNKPAQASPFWLFQVPGTVVTDHSDIFNYKAASLTLALIQMSGVLASAAGEGWKANFSEQELE